MRWLISLKDKINNRINSNVNFIEPDYKSVICFSENFRVCSIKKFNWLQKKMLKAIFGIEVLDYER